MAARIRHSVRTALPALILCASALTAAACGSSGSGGKDSLQQRQSIGREALLVRSDLQGDWSETSTDLYDDTKLDRLMTSCLHIPAGKLAGGAAEVASPTFRRGEAEVVQNSVSVEASTAPAEARYSVFKQSGTVHCLGTSFTHLLEERAAGASSGGLTAGGVAFGRVSVRLLTVVSESDAAIGYRVTIPITALGHSVTAIADLVVMRVGRATTDVVYGGEHEVDAATERRLNILVCQRLRSALAAAR